MGKYYVTINNFPLNPTENLAQGNDLKWATWRTLNRLRTSVERSKSNLLNWVSIQDDLCEGGETKIIDHLLEYPPTPVNILNHYELFIPSDGEAELARH